MRLLYECPAETRLTVYRRFSIRLRGPASWIPEKCRPIYNFGCIFHRGNAFVHYDLYSSVFFLSTSMKKKTRELIGYSFARAKWAGQLAGNFPKSWYFDDIFENFRKFRFFVKWKGIQREPNYYKGVGSTSPPGGNQVDGLPPDSSTGARAS